ncbi:MAG: extracellular solute-binding protein [Actinocrinis sp.]
MNQRATDRRTFLLGSLGAAAAASPLLAGCTTAAAKPSANNSADTAVKLPSYVPYTGVTPDLPGNEQGLLNGFLRYPANPVKVFPSPPGKGDTVSAFVQTALPVPPATGQNPYWQELNKRLGATLELTIVPTTDVAAKFATLIAGGDLPDLIEPGTTLPNNVAAGITTLPQWLAAQCQDLTSFLSGDKIKDYPFLANIPTAAWKAGVYNGGIYGVPVARGVAGTLMFRRDDLFKQAGVNPDPADYNEFVQVCKQMSDAKHNRWALTGGGDALYFVQQMLGVPNNWRYESGKLTHAFEVPEMKEALSAAAKMVAAGYTNPDGFTSSPPVKQWFNSGTAVLHPDRYTAWPQYFQQNIAGPSFDIGGMRPPKYDGGGWAGTYQSAPFNNFTAFKKASPDRVKYLLTICDWLAAPFGTEEYLFRKFGLAGRDYAMTAGSPAQTQTGVSETALSVRYIVDSPDTLFVPGDGAATTKDYDYQKSIIATSVVDPTVGLFSETNTQKAPILGTLISGAQNDIMSGRKPVSSWDEVVTQWRSSGGDAIRGEFEKQLQQAHG